jgi:tetratricopeptide (TPR) repeat protein
MRTGRTTLRALIAALVILAACTRSRQAADTLFNQGMELLKADRNDEAADKFEEVVAADPNHALGWRYLAALRREEQDYSRAILAGRRAVELAPDHADAFYGLGMCQAEVGDRAGALASLRRYLALANPAATAYTESARKMIAYLEHSSPSVAPPAAPGR